MAFKLRGAFAFIVIFTACGLAIVAFVDRVVTAIAFAGEWLRSWAVRHRNLQLLLLQF